MLHMFLNKGRTLRLYVDKGTTPVCTFPDTPEYLKWHTPERRDVRWKILNDTGQVVASHTPARRRAP